MFYIVLTIHIILCVSLVGLVLIQQGKGADMGAAFGSGGSNTFFGAAGATAFITKLTTGIAVAFMVTSILLINLYSSVARNGGISVTGGSDSIQDLIQSSRPGKPDVGTAVATPAGAQTSAPASAAAGAVAPAPAPAVATIAPASLPTTSAPAK